MASAEGSAGRGARGEGRGRAGRRQGSAGPVRPANSPSASTSPSAGRPSPSTPRRPSKASKSEDGDLSGALAEVFLPWQGPVTAACEIDAAGRATSASARVDRRSASSDTASAVDSVLRAFVAAEDNVSKEKYRSVKTGGGLDAVEVEYLYTSKLLEETKKERAPRRQHTPRARSSRTSAGWDTRGARRDAARVRAGQADPMLSLSPSPRRSAVVARPKTGEARARPRTGISWKPTRS
ncbi:lipoprotein [Streptomyces tricolor]|nr:lipoprotein [Streptomyces tricolor]